jgi:hypothetical protein
MKKSIGLGMAVIALVTLLPLIALARMYRVIPPEELMANSTLVFIGKVQNVETSSIATSLSYPAWEGVSFPWLKVDVEVSAPVKGVKPGEIVHVMMLSIQKGEDHPGMVNAPEVLYPEKDDIFLFCLSPTSITNSFAVLTAPYNEFLSVFPLHRAQPANEYNNLRDSGARFLLKEERFAPIRNLLNDHGHINPDVLAKLKETYKTEIETTPTNRIVYLEWRAKTNAAGWVNDVPKSSAETNSAQK